MAEKAIPAPRLTKSATNRVFAGVAGGLGEYFNVDPTLVRLLFVIASFWGGTGVIAYIALAILMPESSGYKPQAIAADISPVKGASTATSRNTGFWIGAVFLAVGLIILLDRLNIFQVDLPAVRWDLVWPVALIIIGIWFLTKR
jgi:phage shock protein PspC (stress-responsive transcriptional regulator)